MSYFDDQETKESIEDAVVRAIFPTAQRQPDGSWTVAPGVTVRNAEVSITVTAQDDKEEDETDEAR